MPPRSYFYKDDNGDIKKFAYCSVCGAGPFKESEKNYKYISLHGRTATNYCTTCMKILGIQSEELIDKHAYVEKEKIKEYSFGTFAKSYIDPYIDIPRLPADQQKETEPEKPVKEKVEEVPPLPPPPVVEEDEPGPFYVYVGQLSDDTFITGVTKDMAKDFLTINSGQSSRIKTLPMEIVYYHIEQTKKDALVAKNSIMTMTPFQKEILIEGFVKKFFEK